MKAKNDIATEMFKFNISQRQVALKSGCSQSFVSKVIRSERKSEKVLSVAHELISERKKILKLN